MLRNWHKGCVSLGLIALFGLSGLCDGVIDQAAEAGSVRLHNGIVIDGTPAPVQSLDPRGSAPAGAFATYPLLLIDNGMQRYFVARRHVAELNADIELAHEEKFELPAPKRTGRGVMLQSVGSFSEVTDFDEFGRRRVTLATVRGPVHVFQSVTEIGPKHLKVVATNYEWEQAIATTSVPPPQLDAMLRKVLDTNDADDRMAIARFYLQAGLYQQSQNELDSVVRDFPDLRERIEETALLLSTEISRRLLTELKHRQTAGQHQLAYVAAKSFPTERMSAAVLREVSDLKAGYDDAIMQLEKIRVLLGEYQAKLDNPKQIEHVPALRSVVNEKLDYESLPRLQAFLQLTDDETLSASEKLALAYSGWVVGSANAITNLEAALRLWEARYLLLEYLRERDSLQRETLLTRLQAVEGVSPKTLSQLIELLPPVFETPGLTTGRAVPITVSQESEAIPVNYSVLLPQEYNPHHRYPMIVALRPAEKTTERELIWWGGPPGEPAQSQRHGYVVIAPEYAAEGRQKYDYDVTAHEIVVRSIRDARKRFNIDSDRVFLAGHGMGADAAYDIGLSHPDLFAGLIAISGTMGNVYEKYYYANARTLPIYAVNGERDRDSFQRNKLVMGRWLLNGFDVVYTEYLGRGYESFYAEIHKLFDWMSLQRRQKHPSEFEVKTLRPGDNRFFWVQVDGLPKSVVPRPNRRGGMRPMPISARVTEGNTVDLKSGSDSTTVWLSPEFVDFDKRVKILVNGGRPKFNDFLRPDIQVMLEDLWFRGDRQQLYLARKVFD